MNTPTTQQRLESIRNQYEGFEPDDFLDITKKFEEDIRTAFTANKNNITFFKIDYIGSSDTYDGESVDIYFDIIWVENKQIQTFPIHLESA